MTGPLVALKRAVRRRAFGALARQAMLSQRLIQLRDAIGCRPTGVLNRRVFFERLVQKRGESKALAFLDDIKEFIKASLINRVGRRALSKIAWAGAEGARLCSEIMHATLTVFVT